MVNGSTTCSSHSVPRSESLDAALIHRNACHFRGTCIRTGCDNKVLGFGTPDHTCFLLAAPLLAIPQDSRSSKTPDFMKGWIFLTSAIFTSDYNVSTVFLLFFFFFSWLLCNFPCFTVLQPVSLCTHPTSENHFLTPWRESHEQMRQHFPIHFCTEEAVPLPQRLPFSLLNIPM